MQDMSTGLSHYERPTAGQAAKPQIFSDYFLEDELAAELDVSVRTLRLWRHHRRGPPWTKVGAKTVYRRTAFFDWLKAAEQQPVRSRHSR
jgi:helix-turn-helix protein